MSTVTSATTHRPERTPEAARERKETGERRGQPREEATAAPGRRRVEDGTTPVALAGHDHAEHRTARDDLDVGQGVTSRHEALVSVRDDAMKAQPSRRRLIAYNIADPHLGDRGRPHDEDVAVAEERQHAGTARTHAQRVAAPQRLRGQVVEERSPRRIERGGRDPRIRRRRR
jgi:hypothetical protein